MSKRGPHQAMRWLLGGGGVLFALVYLAQALAGGRVTHVNGGLQFQTGEFHWIWVPSLRSALALAEAAGFLGLVLGPRRAGWGPLLAGALAIVIAPALVLMQAQVVTNLEAAQWAVALAAGAAICLVIFRTSPAGRWPRRLGGAGLVLLAAACGAAVMVLSWRGVFQDQPVITDSQSQIAQARLLLGGHWRLEIPQALRDVICFPYATPKVPSFSQYPPGYILPLMAVLGLKLPPQAVDIFTAALTAAATVLLARRVAGRAGAFAAAPLLLGSPFFMALSGSGMNHSLCAGLLAAAALCFLAREKTRARMALGGLCLGWVAMTRPVTALAHGAVWIFVLRIADCGLRIKSGKNPHSALRIPHLFWLLAGLALPLAFFLYYNTRTTGNPLVMGYQASNPELHRLGFHGGRLAFTPAMAWHRVAADFCSLNFQLFGWIFGSWVLAGVWLARSPLRRGERVLVALIAAQAGLYAIYQFHDLLLGPRFLYELLPACVVLGAAGLAPTLRRGGRRGAMTAVLIALLSLGGLAEGFQVWAERIGPAAGRNRKIESSIQAALPLRGPTVMIVEGYQEGEMIGRHFEWGRLWFVARPNVEAARKLPELAGWNWVELDE